MALIPSISICKSSDCKSLSLNETTGAYTLINLGGYGTPNVDLSDIISAVLTINIPGSSTPIVIDLFSITPPDNFPSDDPTTPTFIIDSVVLGLGPAGVLSDGLYTFQYDVTDNTNVTYTYSTTFLMTCTIECCVAKLLAEVAKCGCDCDDDAKEDALFAYTLLVALKSSLSCDNNTTKTNNILSSLQRICKFKDCNCGCN